MRLKTTSRGRAWTLINRYGRGGEGRHHSVGTAIVLVVFSLPIVIWMALKRRRPIHLWLLLGLLGTYGAIVWLTVNGPAMVPKAVEKPA